MSPDPYTVGAGIVVAILAMLAYDIYLSQDGVEDNTYSQVLRGWFIRMSWLYYSVAFILGVLMAHWGPV
jgi:hypothetical protein